MSFVAEGFARAAEQMVGAPFKLHGRDPDHGLDCVGLVAAALSLVGRSVPALPHYGLRNTDYRFCAELAGRAGFVPRTGSITTGDLLMARPGPAQRHLLIAIAADRLVHAHAGLRRVVVQPAPAPWPIIAHWRLSVRNPTTRATEAS